MEIPLIVEQFVDEITDMQKLKIWINKECLEVNPPFYPYILTKTPLTFKKEPITIEETKAKPLSSLVEERLWKYTFPNTSHISSINKSLNSSSIAMQNDRIKRLVCENHTKFLERIIIDNPDFFKDFPNTEKLTVMGFDIETLTKDGLDFDSIISIAAGNERGKITSRQIPVHFDESGNPYVNPEEERILIKWFLSLIQKVDPDIICGYWMKDFDFVRIFERCQALGINYQPIARNNIVYYSQEEKKVKMEIGGRILYDLIDSVKADQTIYGIKNHRLKTVAEWKKIPFIKENTKNTCDIPIPDLKKYNESDVFITMALFNIYFGNIKTVAEMFGIPLNMAVDGSASIIPNIFQGSGLKKLNIISDGTNIERYPEIFNRSVPGKKKSKYQAAYVDIFQTGFFPITKKVDFSGMYNLIEITMNASPDTCWIKEYKPYENYGLKFSKNGQFIDYEIPDNIINKNVVVRVDNSKDGLLRTELRRIRAERAIYKKQIKEIKRTLESENREPTEEEKEELEALETKQYGLKVVANVPSGYNGTGFCRYGSIAVSLLTVGVGRTIIKEVIRYIETNYGHKKEFWNSNTDHIEDIPKEMFTVCIEVDTDGIYVSKDIDIDDLNKFVDKRVEEIFGVDNELFLDKDELKESYFVKMKNYILYDELDNLEIHGVSFKASSKPLCFDMALEKLAHCLLKQEGKNLLKTINEVANISNYSIDELVQSSRLNKEPDSYSKTSFWGKLISQARAIGMPVKLGSQLEYVKVHNSYQLVKTVKSKSEIEESYYINMIGDLVTAFGFKKLFDSRTTQELDEWL